MNKKPTIKKEVAVTFYHEGVRHIRFHATQDAVTEFDFGELTEEESADRYSLYVDPRYDFKEVLAFIENYG